MPHPAPGVVSSASDIDCKLKETNNRLSEKKLLRQALEQSKEKSMQYYSQNLNAMSKNMVSSDSPSEVDNIVNADPNTSPNINNLSSILKTNEENTSSERVLLISAPNETINGRHETMDKISNEAKEATTDPNINNVSSVLKVNEEINTSERVLLLSTPNRNGRHGMMDKVSNGAKEATRHTTSEIEQANLPYKIVNNAKETMGSVTIAAEGGRPNPAINNIFSDGNETSGYAAKVLMLNSVPNVHGGYTTYNLVPNHTVVSLSSGNNFYKIYRFKSSTINLHSQNRIMQQSLKNQ